MPRGDQKKKIKPGQTISDRLNIPAEIYNAVASYQNAYKAAHGELISKHEAYLYLMRQGLPKLNEAMDKLKKKAIENIEKL